MIVQTDITQKDFQAFAKRAALGPDGGRLMYALLFGSALGMGVIAGITLPLIGVQLHKTSLLTGLFGGVFWLTVFSQLYGRFVVGPAKDGYILGPRTVSITEDGIRETSQRHEVLLRWTLVRSAESVGEHIFVMVDRNAGIIVPRRAFASDADRDQFLAEIRTRSGLIPAQAPTMKSPAMKKCTWCGKEYAGSETVCPIDAHPLEDIHD